MIDYIYRAKDPATGQIVSAGVQAESPQAAAKLLSQQNLFPLEVVPKSQSGIIAKLGLKRHIGAKDRVLFTRQLSTLINAGLPLARALHTVQDQISNQALNEIIAKIVAAVEGGSSLSSAFAKHPKVFNEIYVAMVAAGETSGTLDKTLARLADQQEKDAAVASKIRSAFVYPIIVSVLIVAVIILMVTTVVPQVAKLYSDLHKNLPLATKLLMWLANFITHQWWIAIPLIVVGVYVGRRWFSTPAMQLWSDKAKLKLPIFGILFQKVYMARFARTMSSLQASGVPVLQALEISRRAITNRPIQHDIDTALTDVRGGKSLSGSLEQSHNFIPLVPQMIKIGEESGEMDTMMGRVAVYYENEVDEAVNNLSATLEPVMMVILGGVVGLILLATLYPVYSLVGSGNLTSGQ